MSEKKNDDGERVFAVATVVFLCAVWFLGGLNLGLETMKYDAIKHGYAQYNAETAKFEWRNE